jgi:tetratricopeptide (TPR) repeat protein
MKTRMLIAAACLATAAPLGAQDLTGAARIADSAQQLIDAARVHSALPQFAEIRALLERGLTAFADDPYLLHYLGYALYVESTLPGAEKSRGDLLAEAQTALEASLKHLELTESFALLSGVMGQRIGLNPLRAITLGSRSGEAMSRAHALGPDNPRVWLLDGVGAIFTPRMFGGGMDRAEERIRRAIALFEHDAPAPPAPRWGKAEAHLWLGQVLQRTGRRDEARVEYQRALGLEPENGWVRDVLMPALDRPQR